MLRQFLGLGPAAPKRSTEEIRKDYDQNKRRRTIVSSWRTEFSDWILTDDTNNRVFCKICRSVYGPLSKRNVADKFRKYANGPFVLGSTNLRHDSLASHEKSEGHKYASDYTKEKSKSSGESTAEKTVQSLKVKGLDLEKIAKLFRGAHALAKMCKPISDFIWVNELQEKNQIEMGSVYRNAKSCKEFMVSIGEVERLKLEQSMKCAKFFTIMSDGSTDVSTVENEIVYINFCLNGSLHTYFLGLMECARADAEGIYSAIMRAIQPIGSKDLSFDQLKNQIIGFAADGASVNTGNLNGVIALFRRRLNPAIVMVKCMSHRVELAYKDAMKKSPLYSKVHCLLDELFKFYSKPKQLAGLRSFSESLNVAASTPTRVGGTRWVGHLQTALRTLFRGYRAFVALLEQVSTVNSGTSGTQSKAKFLLKQLKSKDVISFAHFVKDVINVLVKLSMFMQTRDTCAYRVHREFEITLTNLRKLETRPGPELRSFQQEGQTFQGQTLVGNDTCCQGQITTVIQALVSSMTGRFSDIENGVLSATRLADLMSWPASISETKDFGDEAIQILVDHFRVNLESQGVDVGVVEAEWTMLKDALFNEQKVHSLTWPVIHDVYKERCPNILHLMDLIMTLPAGSSECERGFSQMTRLKTKYRNKMRSTTMTLLLTIQLHSENIVDYDPYPAMHHWSTSTKRRPAFLTRCKLKQKYTLNNTNSDAVVEVIDAMQLEAASVSEEPQVDSNPANSQHEDSDYDSDFSDLDIESERESDVSDCD